MQIQVLLPEILHRPTGGNLFNRHMLDHFDELTQVERRVIQEGSPRSIASKAESADVTLVDSLLLIPAVGELDRTAGRRLLIAHYLHLFEPGRQASPEAERERRALAQLDGVITTSRYCRDLLLDEGFQKRQLAAITPGLASSFASPLVPRPPAPARILTVATLLPGKGLRQLLKILETVADLDWTWELAGDPDLDPDFGADFRHQVESSPVASRIHLHGAVAPDRMVDLYDRCHIFVLPSRFETCSMATMEAMARGLPVIAFSVGGLTERVPSATAPLLAPPGDTDHLTSSLRHLLSDLDHAAALGRENYRASQAFPSWPESGSRLWEFLSQLAPR